MRNAFRTLFLIVLLISAYRLSTPPIANANATGQPEYAKWGIIAVQQTSSKYHADIVDYLHIGRTQVSPGIAEETFKLWLRDKGRELRVRVTIQFYTDNDQIITIKYQETTK